MKEGRFTACCRWLLLGVAFCAGLAGLFFGAIPAMFLRVLLLAFGGVIFLAASLWALWQNRQLSALANDLCDTVDCLMAGRTPSHFAPYEETAFSRVQEKLLQYADAVREERQQNIQDKEILQELVSDISHQVKTPTANIQMMAGILRQHALPREKQLSFLALMTAQIDKLEFLMQSLIKMSRLETGTFVLHLQEAPLSDTIAQAMSTILAKADTKQIQLAADCDSRLTVLHDPKWTAEALANILDNAVKYTPPGGSIGVTVRPWQFYTRIDITDNGIGMDEAQYPMIFQRFYRGEDVAAAEGVGLGLYLARGIISRQNGYITVHSKKGEGSTFSVFLLNGGQRP